MRPAVNNYIGVDPEDVAVTGFCADFAYPYWTLETKRESIREVGLSELLASWLPTCRNGGQDVDMAAYMLTYGFSVDSTD